MVGGCVIGQARQLVATLFATGAVLAFRQRLAGATRAGVDHAAQRVAPVSVQVHASDSLAMVGVVLTGSYRVPPSVPPRALAGLLPMLIGPVFKPTITPADMRTT
jgi:hypothetical protein